MNRKEKEHFTIMNNRKKNTNRKIMNRGKDTLPRFQTSSTPVSINTGYQSMTLNSRRKVHPVIGQEELPDGINGSVAFSNTQIKVNPGLDSFPALQKEAQVYDKYRFKGHLVVTYIPRTAVTTTAGGIYLSADFDPNDSGPSTTTTVSSYECYASGRVGYPLQLRIPMDRAFDGVQNKLVRCGPVAGNYISYDACSFNISTIDCADTSALGIINVSYHCDLNSRQLEPSTRIPQNLVVLNLSDNQVLGPDTAENADFDEVISSGFTLANSSGTYTLPCGAYTIGGGITVFNTTAVACTATIELLVDGASTTPPQLVKSLFTFTATGLVYLPLSFFTSSNTTSTFAISVTLETTGTIYILKDSSRLFVEAK